MEQKSNKRMMILSYKGKLTWDSGYAHNMPFLLVLTLAVAN